MRKIKYSILILIASLSIVGCSSKSNNEDKLESKNEELEQIQIENEEEIKELEDKLNDDTNEKEEVKELEAIDVEKSNLSEDDAREIFKDYYPESEIIISKLEGDVYYIEGKENNSRTKMKIKVSDGSVVFSKKINKF